MVVHVVAVATGARLLVRLEGNKNTPRHMDLVWGVVICCFVLCRTWFYTKDFLGPTATRFIYALLTKYVYVCHDMIAEDMFLWNSQVMCIGLFCQNDITPRPHIIIRVI